MNDRDWFKKFRRGKGGGCASLLAPGLLVATVWACGDPPPPPPVAPPAAPQERPVDVLLDPPPPVPGCPEGDPRRIRVEGERVRSPGGPVLALLADPQARVRPELGRRTGLPLVALTGELGPGEVLQVWDCTGNSHEIAASELEPWDTWILLDNGEDYADLHDARVPEATLRRVVRIVRKRGLDPAGALR